LDKTGPCVDLELTRELPAHRPNGFGARTATLAVIPQLRSLGRYKAALDNRRVSMDMCAVFRLAQ
jgi:hypothetical protein